MKTSVMEVHDMLSVFSIDEVEKRIGEVSGVESVTVDFAAGTATVRFDETRIGRADIKSAVRQRGFKPTAPADGSPGDAHGGDTDSGASPAAAATASSTVRPAAPTVADATPLDKTASATTLEPFSAEPAAAVGDDPKDKAVPEKI